MVSSLAAQLAQAASLNSTLLVDRSRRKPTESYLFVGREADHHDLDAIHAIASSALSQLIQLKPSFRDYEDLLFSDSAKGVDRTLLPGLAGKELSKNLGNFLPLLGVYLTETPTSKVLEWLVRRFRINEFNVEDTLTLFLPYHESPHFAKMVTLLHIKPNSTWSFLNAYRSAAQSVPRQSLVTEMLRNVDLTRFIASLLSNAIQGGYVHRALIAFHTGVFIDYVARDKIIDDGVLAFLLPSLLAPLQTTAEKKPDFKTELILASYILLSALSQRCHLSPAALKTILSSMASCSEQVTSQQFIHATLSVMAPQDELNVLPNVLTARLLGSQDLANILAKALTWTGSEKLVTPLLPELVKRIEQANTLATVESLLTSSPTIPSLLIRKITMLSIADLIANDAAARHGHLRRILSLVQQRHPSIFQDASKSYMDNESTRVAVEQIVLSLSVSYSSAKTADQVRDVDLVIASANADPQVRAVSVRDMLDALANSKVEPAELESIHSALVARVHDTAIPVIAALYANPSAILPILRAHSSTYIQTLVDSINEKGAHSRQLIRLHLTFLAHHYTKGASKEVLKEVFERIIFSFLLFSKPRQKTAQMVWEILETAETHGKTGIEGYEIISGCVDVLRWEEGQVGKKKRKRKDDGGFESLQVMSKVNLSIASRMAETILASNDHSIHFAFLLSKLRDPSPHASNLAYLITRALLGHMTGEHQVDVANLVLDAMGLETLAGMDGFMKNADNLQEFLSDMSLGMNVVLKPSSKNTTHWLQASLLAVMPIILRPTNASIDWLSDAHVEDHDTRSTRYIRLMRTVYRLVNSSTALPLLSTALLRAQFINLAEDTLAFLAGIWLIQSPKSADNEPRYRRAALCHAAAFLAAHESIEQTVDFQTILPALLLALQDPDRSVREAANECLQLLAKLFSKKKATGVYGFDTIYGSHSNHLQYLDWSDLQKYVKAMVELLGHYASDSGYIRIFHHQHLKHNQADSKKDAAYKQRVLCFILSHVNACRLSNVKTSLLHMLEDISDDVKAQNLLPTLQLLVDNSQREELAAVCGDQFAEFSTLLVSSLDSSLIQDFNHSESNLWSVYLGIVALYSNTDSTSSPWKALAFHLEHGLFTGLSLPRKSEISRLLLDVGSRDTNINSIKATLINILQGVPLLIRLLTTLQPSTKDRNQRANKRPKVTQSTTTASDGDSLATLSYLAEVLSNQSLPGSLDLISCLLDTLSKVSLSDGTSQADIIYLQQLLMTAIESSAGHIMDTDEIAPHAIRLDTLVEIIRVADNPQTFHQALLLMASLARLAPESVLHNIMPVFTFMGSNVFHRDDTYSFRVVQKTIDSIVPVMVASLKQKHSERLDLLIASRDFLRIFTDAANHIPRHRRTHFFTHLVDVLGPEEFLAPVCMLIIGKAANRVARQQGDDLHATLTLSLSIIHHYSSGVQMMSLTEILWEAQRLLSHIVDPGSKQPIILDTTHDNEQSSQAPSVFKRRTHALSVFVGVALETSPSASMSAQFNNRTLNELLSALLDIASSRSGLASDEDTSDIRKAAQTSIAQCLKVIPAVNFVESIVAMLQTEESWLQASVLDLFGDRLLSIAESARRQVTPTIVLLIERIITLLGGPINDAVVPAFASLQAINTTLCPGEEGPMVACVPILISALRDRKLAVSAITVLPVLCTKLGPRIIPYFRDIVDECVNILREGIKGKSESTGELLKNALEVLKSLFNAIPTFWGNAELGKIVHLYLDYCSFSADTDDISAFIKSIAKKASPAVLLPALSELWSSLQGAKVKGMASRCEGFLYTLKRALQAAPRAAVMEHLRPLFKLILETFQLRGQLSVLEVPKVEKQAILAFTELVTKLNEASFRPLFRRLFDWAFTDSGVDRKITFCHAYMALLDHFKSLMTPYLSFLLQPSIDLLQGFAVVSDDNVELWTCLIETVTKSFNVDEGGFWREDKLQQIVPPLVAQVSRCVSAGGQGPKDVMSAGLVALGGAVNDDDLLKKINLDVLMHTRSDDARVRLFALQCARALWATHGHKLMGFVSETATFIAECAEDENDSVVKATHKLKDAVESATGERIEA